MTQETLNYRPINENGDFIERDCIFSAYGILYAYSAVVHDDQKVYGIAVSMNETKEREFRFSEVEMIYLPHNPKL